MRLRNKKTGEIGKNESEDIEDKRFCIRSGKTGEVYVYDSLKKLNADWEDYEEPKGKALYWMILTLENFIENEPDDRWVDLEDCKQMLEKLKAWKRLKDKGFKFVGWEDTNNDVNDILFELPYMEWDKNVSDDLDSLFGGEK